MRCVCEEGQARLEGARTMDRLDSSQELCAMSKRSEFLSSLARDLSSHPASGKINSAHRAFQQLAARLQTLSHLLNNADHSLSPPLDGLDAHLLQEELAAEESLLNGLVGRSSLYLLMCSPKIMSELQESGERLKRGVEALSESLVEKLEQQFGSELLKPSHEDEALMDSLEEGMLDTIVVDNDLCSKLAKQVADSIGLEVGSSGFKRELEKLRSEKSIAEARGGKVHALYLEQFLLVLERAVQSANRGEEQLEHRNKEMLASLSLSGRDAPMLPLQPFICPITRDVMKDPVQIGSGQTYEREAIERWFAEGNTRCPVMGEELSTTQMKSNFALKQSIAEWRERNYEARLYGVARYLLVQGGDAEVQVRMVHEVRAVCEEEPLNKYKVGRMGLISPMVRLVESRDAEVRKETLAALVVVARDNPENQEAMVKDGIIDLLVFSLTRQKADLHEAVSLMRILSENPNTAERISHAQGAVVFLVTLLGCEDGEVNHNVKAILENVPTSDENVVIMAEANLMRPLANRIVEGSAQSKILMARALAGMHLPVSSKTSVATEDVIQVLLKMTDGGPSEEAIEAALGALQNLTPVASIAETVIRLEGFKQLEQKLKPVKSSESSKVAAAKILADLSSIAGDLWEQTDTALNELEIYVYKFLELMGPLTPVAVQEHVLKALLGLSTGNSVGRFTVHKLAELKAMELLLPLLKHKTPSSLVRKHALELFCLLSKQFGQDAGVAVKQKPEIMSELLKNLSQDPERISVLGIVESIEDDSQVIKKQIQENESFVNVVTGLVVESSQDATTVEAALGVILKLAKLGVDVQKKMAAAGLVERLVQLLEQDRSRQTRCRAAWILAEFSKQSWNLSKPPKRKSSRSGFIVLCLPWLAQREGVPRSCRVHKGECSVQQSFCLVEADGVVPLVTLLKDALTWKDDTDRASSSLAALLSLTGKDDNVIQSPGGSLLNDGCLAIEKAKGVPAVVSAVSSGGRDAQRYALEIVERLFSDSDFCSQYGASAQMHVIFAAQSGDGHTKRIAGRVLRKLDLVHSQSYYFSATAN